MQRRSLLRFSLAAGASLALAGCGFQLRGLGSDALPFAELDLAGPDDAFTRLVRERLTASGVAVSDAAPLRLNLGRETFNEQRLSVLNSGYQEYDMTLNVSYSVQRSADDAYRLAEQQLEVQERFSISSDNLLAADDRRAEVRERLRDTAVEQLFHRLHVLGDA